MKKIFTNFIQDMPIFIWYKADFILRVLRTINMQQFVLIDLVFLQLFVDKS